jgi:4-carboxymuconolactone decarboxylase
MKEHEEKDMNRRTLLVAGALTGAAAAAGASEHDEWHHGDRKNREFREMTDRMTAANRTEALGRDGTAIVQLAVLTALGDDDGVEHFARRALRDGVDPVKLREAVLHTAPYAGLSKARIGLKAVHEACEEEHMKDPATSATVTDANRFEQGLAVQKKIFGDGIDKMHRTAAADTRGIVVDDLSGWCFGDFYTRTGLSLKERELATVAVIMSLGGCEPQLKAHFGGAAAMGATRAELIALIRCAEPFVGFPRTLNALGLLNQTIPAKQ